MPKSPPLVRRTGRPLLLLVIGLLAVGAAAWAQGGLKYLLFLISLTLLPIQWLLQSPDRDRLLATIVIVTLLLALLSWLRSRRNRTRVS